MPRTSHLLIGGLEVPDESRGPHKVQTFNHCLFSVRVNKKKSRSLRENAVFCVTRERERERERERFEVKFSAVSRGSKQDMQQRTVCMFKRVTNSSTAGTTNSNGTRTISRINKFWWAVRHLNCRMLIVLCKGANYYYYYYYYSVFHYLESAAVLVFLY